MRRTILLIALLMLLPLSGCAYFSNLQSRDRLCRGNVIVLSGIETPSVFTSNIAQGLADAGWGGGIEIHDWTTGHFINFGRHLIDIDRNREQAAILTDKIVAYQDRYPGAPLHLIGHSGGTGIIAFALEDLPNDRCVTSTTFLASALSPNYDLSKALSKSESGLWSYHSPGDFLLCGAGTSLLGTIDRQHRPAAALVGFKRPSELNSEEQALYATRLHQVPYRLDMLFDGHISDHFGCTTPLFVRRRIAPEIIRTSR